MRSLRRSRLLEIAFCALLASGCVVGPTEQDFDNLFQPLQSVAGAWTGTASSDPASVVAFAFTLNQGQDGAVTGSGTMQEQANAQVSITIAGSYRNQTLVLTFTGMVYETVAVQGAFQSQSAPVIGAAGPLLLTGTSSSYNKTLNMVLIKQ